METFYVFGTVWVLVLLVLVLVKISQYRGVLIELVDENNELRGIVKDKNSKINEWQRFFDVEHKKYKKLINASQVRTHYYKKKLLATEISCSHSIGYVKKSISNLLQMNI